MGELFQVLSAKPNENSHTAGRWAVERRRALSPDVRRFTSPTPIKARGLMAVSEGRQDDHEQPRCNKRHHGGPAAKDCLTA
jgi:hypothetical protein